MWYVENDTGPHHSQESAVEESTRLAKEKNSTININYLNYDSERATSDNVARAYPCGCVENAPGWRRRGQWIVKCDEHKENND